MTTAPSVEPNRLWLSIEVRTWHTFEQESDLIRPLTQEATGGKIVIGSGRE